MLNYNSPVLQPLCTNLLWTKIDTLGLLPPSIRLHSVHLHLPHNRFGMVHLLLKVTLFCCFQNLCTENNSFLFAFVCCLYFHSTQMCAFSPPTTFSINASLFAPTAPPTVHFPRLTMTVNVTKAHFVPWYSFLTLFLWLPYCYIFLDFPSAFLAIFFYRLISL